MEEFNKEASYKITKYEFVRSEYRKKIVYLLEMKVYSETFIMNRIITSSPETLAKVLNLKLRHCAKILNNYNDEFSLDANFYHVWFKSEEDANRFCEKYINHLIIMNKFL